MRAIDKAGSAFLRAILQRMKELGVSQTELAKRMDASRPYITKVLNGDVNITFGTATRFAKALQMDFMPVLMPKGKRGAGPALVHMPSIHVNVQEGRS